MRPLITDRQTKADDRQRTSRKLPGSTPNRSRIITGIEDISLWLAIVLLLSLHPIYDQAQSPVFRLTTPEMPQGEPAATWQMPGNQVAGRNRSAG
jgi:hypothetical protein